MQYHSSQLIFFFFLYSIAGWLVMTAIRSIQNRKPVNVGVLDGPVCPSWGLFFTLCIWLAGEHRAPVWWQIFLCMVIGFLILTLDSRHSTRVLGQSHKDILERMLFLFGRFAAPVMYILVGLTGFFVSSMLQPVLLIFINLLPQMLLLVLDIALIGVFVIDLITSGIVLQRFRNNRSRIQREITFGLDEARISLARKVVHLLYRRLIRAYPEMGGTEETEETIAEPDSGRIFASGTGFVKMFWVFLICALAGDLIEMVYCGVVDGKWMSRSSFLYGSLSIVWGGGAALGAAILAPLEKKNDRWVFLGGFLLGGAYEYLCSVFTEVVFGQVFWDYSDFPLNIGGRTNVLFMFFWGIAALILVKFLYPLLSGFIEKIKPLPGLILTWIFMIVLVFDLLITGLALGRYSMRSRYPKADNQISAYLDEHFPDSFIENRWKNMKAAETVDGS